MTPRCVYKKRAMKIRDVLVYCCRYVHHGSLSRLDNKMCLQTLSFNLMISASSDNDVSGSSPSSSAGKHPPNQVNIYSKYQNRIDKVCVCVCECANKYICCKTLCLSLSFTFAGFTSIRCFKSWHKVQRCCEWGSMGGESWGVQSVPGRAWTRGQEDLHWTRLHHLRGGSVWCCHRWCCRDRYWG